MTDSGKSKSWLGRILLLGVLMMVALFILGRRLHSVQIEETRIYENSQRKQSVRRVLLPAPRGRIYDREGECLADNRPSYCIAFYLEDMKKPGAWSNTVNAIDAKVNELSLKLAIPRQISREDIRKHIRRQLPMPLLVWQDVDERVLARFSEMITADSGMDVYVQAERVYPKGRAGAHLIGYVGREKPATEDEEVSHYNVMGMRGRSGVEKEREEDLAGTAGGQLLTVDVSGCRRSVTNCPAIPGKDIHLTILSRLQEVVEREVGHRKAAVVAIDPRNGDVLAMASEPAFDPNHMSPRVSSELWKRLMDDPMKPLLNRALTGVYPPGSTFKPAVALVALEKGISPAYSIDCNGVFTLGAMKLRCAARYGHGPGITMRKGIEYSCNPYFCSLGVHVGIDSVRDFADRLGFGRKTGIRLSGEAKGLLPDDAWKRKNRNEGWRAGDTANLSIGQGYLLVTPLQLGMYASVLANGGKLYHPRLFQDDPVSLAADLQIPKRHLDVVRGGMYDVVNAQKGGGRHARVAGVTIAAKTGTAEYGASSNRKKHTWMVAFAPYEKPQIAVAVLVEDGESGGLTAAPVVAAVFKEYFGVTDSVHIEDCGVSEYSQPELEEVMTAEEADVQSEGADADGSKPDQEGERGRAEGETSEGNPGTDGGEP